MYYTYFIILTNKESSLFGKIYFGKCCHKGNYIGSGRILKDYLKKFPNDYFRGIINYYNSKEECAKAEYELIRQHLGKEYCINIKNGGDGGSLKGYKHNYPKNRKSISRDYQTRKKISDTMKKIPNSRKGRKYMTDGINKVYIEPEYWGEFLDIGYHFGIN